MGKALACPNDGVTSLWKEAEAIVAKYEELYGPIEEAPADD